MARLPDVAERRVHITGVRGVQPSDTIAYIPVNYEGSTWPISALRMGWRQMCRPERRKARVGLFVSAGKGILVDGHQQAALRGRPPPKSGLVSTDGPGPMTGWVMETGGNLVLQRNVDGTVNAYRAADTGKLSLSFQTKVL